MSPTPLEDLTMQGYQAPRVVQFNIFLDNRVGKLLEVLELLEENGQRVAGLSIVDANDYAVIRLVACRSEVVRKLLSKAAMPFSETEVLAIQLQPPQTLAQLCRILLAAEINILYAYPLLVMPHEHPAVVLHTEDQHLTGELLYRKHFVLLGEAELDQPGSSPV